MKNIKVLVVLVVVGLAGLLLLAASTTASSGDPNEVISATEEASPQADVLTKDDMLNAKPLPMPEAVGGPIIDDAVEDVSGGAIVIPGKKRGVSGRTQVAALDEGVEPLVIYTNRHYFYPPPFTTFKVSQYRDYLRYPQRTTGVLFFKKPGSSSWWRCSASVAVNRAVWTAGHCVYTKGKGWHTNITFVPAYREGDAPYGVWTVIKKVTLNGWIQGKYPYDIGMVVVANKAGKKISQRVGYLCFVYNATRTQHWHVIGYPAASPFNGKWPWITTASHAWDDKRQGTPYTIGIGSDQTGGSSGGPWLIKYAPDRGGAYNCVNGVVSYRYTSPSQPKALHGPYFGTGARNLYNWGKIQ